VRRLLTLVVIAACIAALRERRIRTLEGQLAPKIPR